MTWAEGRDGDTPQYRERLYPAWWVWLAISGFVSCIGVAYGYVFGARAGLLTTGVGLAAMAALLVVTSPLLRVDERVFRAGHARLPVDRVGRILPLDEEASFEARSTYVDPAAFMLLRTLTTSTSVMVEVTDSDDPHPYWLVSTKHPRELSAHLRATRDRSRGARGQTAAETAG